MSPIELPQRIIEMVLLPKRGTLVPVRALYSGEALRLEALLKGVTEVAQMTAVLLAAYVCHPDGSDLYSTEQAGEALERAAPQDVQAIIEAGQRLNSLEDKAVEDAGKN